MPALIDTWASLNYIAPEVVQDLGLNRQTAPNKNVVLAYGQNVHTNSCVTSKFLVEAQEISGLEKVIFCVKCGVQHLDSGWQASNPLWTQMVSWKEENRSLHTTPNWHQVQGSHVLHPGHLMLYYPGHDFSTWLLHHHQPQTSMSDPVKRWRYLTEDPFRVKEEASSRWSWVEADVITSTFTCKGSHSDYHDQAAKETRCWSLFGSDQRSRSSWTPRTFWQLQGGPFPRIRSVKDNFV